MNGAYPRCRLDQNRRLMSAASKPTWEVTAVQNLVRYRPAGTYFARFKVNGKPILKTLETTVFSVAKQRLPEVMRDHRAKLESLTVVAIDKMTVADAVRAYQEKVHANVSLKPRSKDYYDGLMISSIVRGRRFSERMCVR